MPYKAETPLSPCKEKPENAARTFTTANICVHTCKQAKQKLFELFIWGCKIYGSVTPYEIPIWKKPYMFPPISPYPHIPISNNAIYMGPIRSHIWCFLVGLCTPVPSMPKGFYKSECFSPKTKLQMGRATRLYTNALLWQSTWPYFFTLYADRLKPRREGSFQWPILAVIIPVHKTWTYLAWLFSASWTCCKIHSSHGWAAVAIIFICSKTTHLVEIKFHLLLQDALLLDKKGVSCVKCFH